MTTISTLKDLVERQQFDEAILLYRTALRPQSNWLESNRVLARALVEADRDADAIPLLEAAASSGRALAWVGHLRSIVCGRAGDQAGQLDHLREAYEIDPATVEIAESYVTALRQHGRDADAVAVMTEHHAHSIGAMASLPVWAEPSKGSDEAPAAVARGLYLDLLERTVSNWIYADARNQLGQILPFDEARRREGRDIPVQAHTMIGLRRLRHLRALAEDALLRRVEGDFVETGVWRGGACILLAGVLKAHADSVRHVVVADSFEGLPPPDPRYSKDALSKFDFHLRPELAVGLEEVRGNFERYDLLSEQVVFLKGFFRDTLPGYPLGPIAVLRLDGDLYSSTMDALEHLYDRVSPGGYVIIDDYGVVIDARRATLDFRISREITAPMIAVDGDAIFWQKPA